jgi:hypothetical protein
MFMEGSIAYNLWTKVLFTIDDNINILETTLYASIKLNEISYSYPENGGSMLL